MGFDVGQTQVQTLSCIWQLDTAQEERMQKSPPIFSEFSKPLSLSCSLEPKAGSLEAPIQGWRWRAGDVDGVPWDLPFYKRKGNQVDQSKTEKGPLPLLRSQERLSYGFFWYIHGVAFLYLNLLSIWNLFLGRFFTTEPLGKPCTNRCASVWDSCIMGLVGAVS